jgi:hypothetical protein
MQVESQLLAQGIVKLAKKIKDTKYVSAISCDEKALKIDYSDGCKQKIELPLIKKEIITTVDNSKEIQEIKKQINCDLEKHCASFNKTLKKQSKELKKNKEELESELVAHVDGEIKNIAAKYFNIAKNDKNEIHGLLEELETKVIALIDQAISTIEVKDGKDADEEKIIAEISKQLSGQLAEELQKGLEEIKQSLPEVKDGADGKPADEEAIFLKLEGKLEALVLNFKVKDGIDGQDGRDGRDADEEAITERIKLLLLDKLNAYVLEATSKVDEALIKKEEELKIAILDIIKAQIALIPEPRDGIDGRDGQDANEEAIKAQVLADVELYVQQKMLSSYAQLEQLVISLVSNIKLPEPIRGPRGECGPAGRDGKSIKGDKGNGIKDAKIDPTGELVIYTDEKKIYAGKVGITNVYGGGGNPLYTNSHPIPFDVGQIKAGTRFKNADLRVVFTKLFYGFDFPEFDTFFVQNTDNIDIGGRFEIGYTIPAGDYLFNFNIINPELLEEKSIFIEHDGVLLAEQLDNISPVTIALTEFQKVTAGDTVFKISGYDTTGVTFQKDYIVQYQYRIYYGEYTDDIEDTGLPNPLSILRATELVSDIKSEYFFLGVGYKWFCYPENLGENYIFYELTSDIAVIFEYPRKITITNEYGVDVTYNCYRTTNEINQEFTMGIK